MKTLPLIVACLLVSIEHRAQNVLLSENFTTYEATAGTAPAGWFFSSHASYTSTTNSGPSGPNSYKFGATNTEVITAEFPEIADSVIFWIKGVSTDSLSSFLIEQYNKSALTWDTLTLILPISKTGTVYRFALDSGTSQLKFTYFKSVGNLAFDDFSVTTNNTADFTAPVITLIGPAAMTAFTDTVFNDPGATAMDNVDGDISGKIVRTGFIKSDSVGTYTLFYNVSDLAGNPAQEVTRIVTIIDSDTIPPVIILNGTAPYSMTVGGSYLESGATAFDNVDGDLTSSISISGSVDSSQTGIYQISYSVTDNSGNTATIIREVHVYSQPGLSCAYPFFSEYIDPVSGNSKVIEIYNPTGFNINMSEYSLHKFTNGATSSTVQNLDGILQAGGTYIICHDLADTTVLVMANLKSSFFSFNGDDGLMLMKGSDTLDIFGRIGQDPGASWANSDSTITTANMTLRRKASVTFGVINNPSAFDPSAQWFPFDAADFSGLGNHTMDTCDFSTNMKNDLAVAENNFYLFPNPAINYLSFTSSNTDDNISGFEIIDISGHVIVKEKINFTKNINFQKVNIQNIKPGFYFLNLTTENKKAKQQYYKFIVIR